MERTAVQQSAKQSDDHYATVSVAFVQAIEKPVKEPHYHESYRDGQRKRIYEGLPAEHFFHYEYQLLPAGKGQQGQVFKTDVVVFGGVVSKIYTDKDNRVVQCWSESEAEEHQEQEKGGQLNQYGWRHKHTFKVSKSLLLELYNHELEVKVWNTKTKLSARARYDRPKAFRLPAPAPKKAHSDSEDGGTPERTVKRPAKLPVVSHDRVRAYNKGGRTLKQSSNTSIQAAPSSQSLDSEGSGGDLGRSLSPREVKTEGSPIPEETSENKVGQLTVAVNSSSNCSHGTASTGGRVLSRRTLKLLEAEAAERAREEREGLVTLRLSLADLFAKQGVISTEIDDPIKNIKGLEVTVSAATPLMPEQLLKELNPLTITVVKATGLPDYPISHQQLSKKCMPVYTKYQFGSCPAHSSKPRPHSHSITFNDFHVFLLGTFDPSLLVELLRGPSLLIELHDRDRRLVKNSSPSLFGYESKDSVLGTHAFGKSSSLNEARPWDPYGVTHLDLSGLLLGQRLIQVKCPVNCGPRGPSPSHSSIAMATRDINVMCSPVSASLPPGDYIGSHCELSVTVELSHPLQLSSPSLSAPITASPLPSPQTTPTRAVSKTTPTRHASKTTPLSSKQSPRTRKKREKGGGEEEEGRGFSSCPFNRLVYIITTEGKSLVQQLLMKVNEINAKALGFEDLTDKMRFAALSTYKLTREQMDSNSCDVITGFHVEDWEQHIIVLEGLRDKGIDSLWQHLPHHTTQDNQIIKVFYNSGYAFSCRLYASLDVDLPHIRLYQPLSELTQHSLIYVRESLSHKVFSCLMCLSSLSVVNEMSELFRNNLLPSSDQVAALSLQFAQPLRLDSDDLSGLSDFKSSSSPADPMPERPSTPDLQCTSRLMSRRIRASLDMTNTEFEEHLQERARKPATNFVKTNVLSTQATSEANKTLPWSVARRRRRDRQRSLSESSVGGSVHIYSSQKLNSTELGKAELRERLHPLSRYTYSQQYHSMTVLPIDVEAQQRAQRLSSQRQWRTEDGFVYPSPRSALESNAHKKQLDAARVHDLNQPFKDNLLHANTLQPTVNRLEFSWERRKEDFERWKAPPLHIGPAPPTTIHLAGESRGRELQEYLDCEYQKWLDKLIVKDTNFYTHRQGVHSEQGKGASCQLNKLHGILKDPPQKFSLKREGLSFPPTPALAVVHDPSLEAHVNILNVSEGGEQDGGVESCRGYAPGPDQSKSLRRDCNRIPRYGRGTGKCEEEAEVKALHGEDFRLYYHLPTLLYKRPTSRQGECGGKKEVSPFVSCPPVGGSALETVNHSVLVDQTIT